QHQPDDPETRTRDGVDRRAPGRAGTLHVRVQPDVRRRAQLHARRARRPRADERAMTRSARLVAASAIAFVAIAVLASAQRAVLPGDPLPGISPTEFEEFRLGLDDFTEVETPEDGLGPAFNGTSCAACHNVPAIGGTSVIAETRAGYRTADGPSGLAADGNTPMHPVSVPPPQCPPTAPDDPNAS